MIHMEDLEDLLQINIIRVIDNFCNHQGIELYPDELLESISQEQATCIIKRLMEGK